MQRRRLLLATLGLSMVLALVPSSSIAQSSCDVVDGWCIDPTAVLTCSELVEIVEQDDLFPPPPCPGDSPHQVGEAGPSFTIFFFADGGSIWFGNVECVTPTGEPCEPTLTLGTDVPITGACNGRTESAHRAGGGNQIAVKGFIKCDPIQNYQKVETWLIAQNRGSIAYDQTGGSPPQPVQYMARPCVSCPQPGDHYWGYSFFSVRARNGNWYYNREWSPTRRWLNC